MKGILASSVKASTASIYQRNWEAFHTFSTTTLQRSDALPADPADVCLYITHLHQKGLSYKTIVTYTSSISFVHKLYGKSDPTAAFIVTKTLHGLKNRLTHTPSRQLSPITKGILQQLVAILPSILTCDYNQKLWTAVFSLSYHACLRAGEAVQSTSKEHTLHYSQLSITPSHVKITFKTYKHSSHRTPTILLQKDTQHNSCPVRTLQEYLRLRGTQSGPLFMTQNHIPIDRSAFSSTLKTTVRAIGLDPSNYNTHSFRIGRATQLAQDHHTDATIRSAGRWRSSAYLQYIRPQNVTLPQ